MILFKFLLNGTKKSLWAEFFRDIFFGMISEPYGKAGFYIEVPKNGAFK